MKLKVASIQMVSENDNVIKNKLNAEKLIQKALDSGVQLILLPEFAIIGYEYSDSIWNVAEPIKGSTYEWLKKICIEKDVFIGTCILEKYGDDFYDTFILTGPGPSDFWFHRKIEPASYEAFYIKGGGITQDVFVTPLGRIGVAICLDTTKTHTLKSLVKNEPELLLIPFSYPDFPDFYPVKARKAWKDEFVKIPAKYSSALQVPVISCNKTGKFESEVPMMGKMKTTSLYIDVSFILDVNGKVIAKTQPGEQVLVGEIEINSKTEQGASVILKNTRWLLSFTAFVRFTTDTSYRIGKIRYKLSKKRKLAAK